MIKLYSFLEIVSQIDNNSNGYAPVGELSPYAKTFVPNNTSLWIEELTFTHFNYFAPELTGINLGEENPLNILPALSALAVKIEGSAIHTGTTAGNATLAWAQGLIDQNAGPTFNFSVTAVGSEVTVGSNKTVSFLTVEIEHIANSYFWEVHLWLTDALFRTEYPLGYFTVVPPITNPLDFINNFPIAKNTITNRTLDQHINLAQTFLLGKVITGLESITLRVYDITNPADYFDCPFMVGYNGQAGINYSALIGAVGDYLVGLGGGFDFDDWVEAIPQLNTLGTFFIIPIWDNIAIPNPNNTLPPISYNPLRKIYGNGEFVSTTIEDTYFMNGITPVYALNKVRDTIEYAVSSFKSTGFFIMPDPGNEGGNYVAFSTKFPDYIIVNINVIDSSNLSILTENVIRDIHMTIQQAEIWEYGNPAPNGYAVETINGIRYMSLAAPYGRAKIYVVTKENYVSV